MSDRMDKALEAFDRALGSQRNARRVREAVLALPDGRRVITEYGSGQGEVTTMTQKPKLTEAEHVAIAAKVLEGMKPPKPLHEMSADESIAHRNEAWAGIVRPYRSDPLTISEWLAQ